MDLPYKKRHRIPASCSVCRKRKSRCDRVKPVCGSCKKKSIAHLCFYESDSKDDVDPPHAHIPAYNPYPPQPLQQHQQIQHQQLQSLPPHPQGSLPHSQQQPPPQHQQLQHQQSQNQQQSQHQQSLGHNIPPPLGSLPHPSVHLPHYVQSPAGSEYHDPYQRLQRQHSVHGQTPQSHPVQALPPPNLPPPPSHHHTSSLHSTQHFASPDSPEHFMSPSSGNSNRGSVYEAPYSGPRQPSATSYTHPHYNQQQSSLPPFIPGLQPKYPYTPVNNSNSGTEKRDSITSASSSAYPDPISTAGTGVSSVFSRPHSKALPPSTSTMPDNNNNSNNSTDPYPESSTKPALKMSPSSKAPPLVSVSLGPNSTLQVNPQDTMTIFANASHALNLEGPLWQQQGIMSYIGLTKSDPFIKILRSYALLLVKTGSMASFIKDETLKRRKKEPNFSTSSFMGESMSSNNYNHTPTGVSDTTPNRRRFDSPGSKNTSPASHISHGSDDLHSESRVEVDAEPGDIVEEDGLIVDRIKVSSVNSNPEDDETNEQDDNEQNDNDQNDNDQDTSNAIKEEEESANKKRRAVSENGFNDETKKDDIKAPTATIPAKRPRSKSSDKIDLSHILPTLNVHSIDKKNRASYYAHVSDVIVKILPKKINMFKLFCRFFKYVHPFVSVVEESSFQMDLTSIFPSFPQFTHEYYTSINLENENSLNILGIFLLMMRLGYLSLIHNDDVNNQYNDDEMSIINDMKRASSETFVSVLKLCISDNLIASKSSFKLVQCLTLLYFYRSVVPDDCHGLGGADANVLFGVIMTHALSIGLNRDPAQYVQHEVISKRETLIKTWRSLWFHLTLIDASASINTGTPLKLPYLDACDVLPPYVADDKTGEINESIRKITLIAETYRNIVNKITNVQRKPKVIDLLTETNHLEKVFFEFFGKDFFKDVICKPAKIEPPNGFGMTSLEREESFVKVIKFCSFIQLRTNLSCLYYMIAIHYENEYSESKTPSMKAGIELFKIFSKSVIQLVYIMSYALDNSVELFGRNYDYILTAHNERCMIKTHSFLTSFFVRLLHHKKDCSLNLHRDPSLKARLEVMNALFTIVLIEAELFVGNFRKLSRTYINSYKLYVMSYFVLRQCMDNPEIFFQKSMADPRFDHQGTNMLEFFSVYELQYLCKLCEEFRAAKEEQHRLKALKKNAAHARGMIRTGSLTDKSSIPFDVPFPASYSSIPSISFLNVSPSTQAPQESNSSTPGNYNSSQGPPFSEANFKSNVPLSFSKENTLGSLEAVNAAELSQPVYSNLNNFNYGVFENPEIGSEDILKLFEVYVDFDKNDI